MAFTSFGAVTSEPVSAMEKVCKITGTKVFVREGAGTKYDSIGMLEKGTYRVIKGTKKDSKGVKWYKVSVKSKTGYVCSKYAPKVKVKVSKVSNLKGTVKVSSGSLFTRSGPGSLYKVKGKLAKGKKITITGKAKDVNGTLWYKTKVGGKNVYVCSKYVTTKSSAKATTKATTAKATTAKATTTATTTKATTTKATTTKATTVSYTVTSVSNLIGTVNTESSTLLVRTGPATSYSTLGSMKKGTEFAITGKTTVSGAIWYRLTYSGKTGFVSGAFVETKSGTLSETTTQTTTAPAASAKTIKARKAAVDWAIKIANDNSFHYGESKWAHHNGCYFCGTNQSKNSLKRKDGGSLSQVEKTYCCNPFVTAAYCHGAGAKEVDCTVSSKRFGLANDTNTVFKNTASWQKVSKPSKVTSLEVGDILLTPTHAMLYVGDGKVAHAAHHDNGKKDSYWNESITVSKISSSSWSKTTKIYRYLGTGKY